MPIPIKFHLALGLAASLIAGGLHAAGDSATENLEELGDLSIEQLLNESVTSVSKKEQKLGDAATAITVLTNDDLRRSGATTIADALRLVPGLDVGSVNSSAMAISARGFNSLYANKLLVLVDGRAVYTPVFAGVYWDLQQTPLQDVDRIEVIRGPGATVWGANAVNGVINVVTRSARDTQGELAYAGGGDVHRGMAGARHGGQAGEKTYYRIFGGYFNDAAFPLASGERDGDSWQAGQAGFRLDHDSQPDTHWTWQADATRADLDDGNSDAYNVNTLGRWSRQLSAKSSVEVQAYFDRINRNEPARASATLTTLDLGVQHRFDLGSRHDIIWGLGLRRFAADFEQTNPLIALRNDHSRLHLYSAFVQGEYGLVPERFLLTAGVKLEHNDFTGFEVQPSVRALFKPAPDHVVWAALSRAVRSPDILEFEDKFVIAVAPPFQGPDGGYYVPSFVGNPELRSEVLIATELGYRVRLAERASLDLATFYNDYRREIGQGSVQRLTPGDPVGVAEMPWENNTSGTTWGGEAQLTVIPRSHWRLTGSYALLVAQLEGPPGGDAESTEQNSPRHQAGLRSALDFSERWGIDAQARYVSSLPDVPAYSTADLRLWWQPRPRLELSLAGQNLLDRQHLEQGTQFFALSTEVPRGVYARLTWQLE